MGATVTLTELLAFLERTLGDAGGNDPDMANGLQFRGKEEIRKVATGVSASLELFQMAVARRADCLVVHHGMPVPRSPYIDPIFARRLEYLASTGLSLLGYHYLLDSHPEIGHNAQIVRKLGAHRTAPFHNGWGWYAEYPEPRERDSVIRDCRSLFGQSRAEYVFGPDRIRRLIALAGSGSPQYAELPEIVAEQVDLYITGDIREWDREATREAGLNLFAGGHYNTERFGLWALGDSIARELGVDVEFVDLPNEV